jgi:hypothetical protein
LLAENTAAAATGNQASVFFPTSTGASTYWQLIGRQNSATANDQTLRVVFGGVAQHTYFNASDLSVQSGITLKVLDTTASTGTSSGALVVSGGVGVAGAIFAGGNIQSNAVFAANNTTLYLRPSGASVSSGQVIIETTGNITASGDLQFTANNTYDVGSSTNQIRAVHVRDLFVGTATPASASATGTAGQITWDASYIYVCTGTNQWKRVAIATW